ncbi:MAG: ABC transporter ATP-binding protein [Burkholderiales bacterium]|nr:MAG: ABC transporter ATP-binding protein [Burkholderiales bacterium]
MSALLHVERLDAGYGARAILEQVSIDVAAGEIVTVVGHNGAGKSTLLRAIFNLIPFRAGVIELDGRDLLPFSPERLLETGIAYVPQGRSVFPRLTVAENLRLGGYVVTDASLLEARIARVETLFPVLTERSTQLAGTLSGGEQRMLEIARALLVEPKLVMLDEPSIGLAPRLVDAVFDTVRLLRERGIAVLMVEQNVRKALAASDRGYVMELGQIRLADRAGALSDDPRVARLYLGKR